MTAIAVAPIVLKDVTLKIGNDNYEAHVSQVEFVPTASVVNWKGLSPSAVFAFPTSATWVCNLSYAQDWVTPNSLSRYLYDHEGEVIEGCTFEPQAGGPGWQADLLITPGAIGGTVDSVAVGTVSLGVQGRPTPIP